jgi:large subunit ribosomal protein L10
MARPDKAADVAELVEAFQESAGAVLTEYRGLTVKQLQNLRRALGENADYAVVKNTLTKIAATEAGVEGFDDLLTGPTAIAFTAEIAKIADLESREVLLAKLAGGMLASLSQAVYLLNAPLSQAARLAAALQAKAEEDPSVLKGGAGEPATPAASDEATEDETAAEPATDASAAAEETSEA